MPDEGPRAAAASVDGVLGLLSAARYWEWKVKTEPAHPQVVVPRGRNVSARRRVGVELRWAQLDPGDHDGMATSRVRTVIDCARFLPFDEALAVADSALRSRTISRTELLLAAERCPRSGRTRAFEVIEQASAKAANPFESVLRAIVLQIPDAHFAPQGWIGHRRADLVDAERRIVLEADSVEFHTEPADFERDIVRYNAFVVDGWIVLRFSWQQVMFDPDYVLQCVKAVLGMGRRSVGRGTVALSA